MSKKIMIVDDQLGIRILLKEVLNKEGFKTYQAANGKEALQLLKEHRPDLVLLDMKIPGMDGIEILKEIKKFDANTTVIMMTAYGELDMIKEAKRLGALMHFTKPFDVEQVRETVEHYLTGKADGQRDGNANQDMVY
jgi:two-component system response regulator (stage 0 sporulation protein F)